jgi:pyrrolidone-carboxylate peptidase
MKKIINKISRGILYTTFIGLSIFNPNWKKDSILITGFGDSPYTPNNPTKELMQHFSKKGYKTCVLNADYEEAYQNLNEFYYNLKPKKIISLGVSSKPNYINVSINANNLMHASKPDYSGNIHNKDTINKSLPSRLSISNEDINNLAVNFDKNNIKYKLDSIPGTYVCNSLLFRGINLSKEKGVKFYFFHVPYDIIINKDKFNNLEKAIEVICEN